MQAILWVSVLIALIFAGCDRRESTLHLVLVDVSLSAGADKALYADAFDGVVESVDVGDRLVVGAISGKTNEEFRALSFEVEPSGRRLVDRAALDGLRVDARAAFGALAGDGKLTCILQALDRAAEIAAADPHDRVHLLVLSDMVEDSPEAKLLTLTSAETDSLLARRAREGLVPNLSRVTVTVLGAKGVDAATYEKHKQFWCAYFDATGAVLASYGRDGVLVGRGA